VTDLLNTPELTGDANALTPRPDMTLESLE
jgi:hypothetical protein